MNLSRALSHLLSRKLAILAIAIAAMAVAGVAAAPALKQAGFGQAPGQQKRNFTISGGLATQLTPGTSGALNLSFGNPNQQALEIERLTVSVTGTDSAACGPDNFTTTQYAGSYPIAIPRGNSHLSHARAAATWPRVAMIDKPVNQDACKGVTVHLAYTGTAAK
jgi:hypothetical protein